MTEGSHAADIVVAGHICLDILPTFRGEPRPLSAWLAPGKLLKVGAAVLATGGCVANTGLALHRLGVPVRLVGKVGADLFGRAILDILAAHGPRLAEGMIVIPGEESSYTIVLSPPGVDRLFLHNPGANDTFTAQDVGPERLQGARYFHFGYPPLLRRTYLEGGAELLQLMQQAKDLGLTASLDMADPDPASEAGQVDWPALLERVLPQVDIFLPSYGEIAWMLDREHAAAPAGGARLRAISQRLLDLGAAIVVLKLGEQGIYLRTTSDRARLQAMGAGQPADLSRWLGRELLAPGFECSVIGTTGAGDCAIAGFLAGLSKGLPPEETLTMAAAVGGFNVESPDAVSGIPTWDAVRARVESGWARRSTSIILT